jgi:hypothetical protein
MKWIHLFYIIFREGYSIHYTTLKFSTYLEDVLETRNSITRTVALQTQDSCWYSLIMDQGQMKGIHLFS